MAFSVEGRVPFLDYRLVEFIMSLPTEHKIREGYSKNVLREGMRGILPEKIRLRVNKLGFATPEKDWQKSILQDLTRQAIKSKALQAFISPETTQRMVDVIVSHGRSDWTPWRLVSTYAWMKKYGL